jgi:hypothetical protein
MIPIRDVHQIEITSECNLRCRYCIHPTMTRPKQHMSTDVWERALDWVTYFVRQGTQHELSLQGVGESTMHPKFTEWISQARAHVGDACVLVFATNGVSFTEAIAEACKEHKVHVFVSLHRPEKAGIAIEVAKKAGVLSGVSADPSVAATDWAGQVKWHVSAAPNRECMWVKNGKVFVDSVGNIRPCSLNGSKDGVIGRVFDDLTKIKTGPYRLCATCDQDVGVPINFAEEQKICNTL